MVKFHKCNLTDSLIDQWVNTDMNVLLIGEKGVGKSHIILDAFDRNNLKHAYFSGATLDPWIHLLGIPKAKLQADGSEKMEFILPENLDNDVEAIFCDEWNRTNKVVRNALLELQQFKSINGRKFPKLRMVWGAVNPPKSDDDIESADYDVDELDPAQLDRFHIIVELPNEPNFKYFQKKFGTYRGKILVDWWKEQTVESKKILSPRRLEYLGTAFNKGLDIKYLLPVSANPFELVKKLSSDEKSDAIEALLNNPVEEEMVTFLSDDENFLKYKNRLKEQKYWGFWKYVKKEFVMDEIKTNDNFSTFAIYNVLKKDPFYKDQIVEITKANPTNNIIKVIKCLQDQKYTLPSDDSFRNFISGAPNFKTFLNAKAETASHGIPFDNFSTDPRLETARTAIIRGQRPQFTLDTYNRRKLLDLLMNGFPRLIDGGSLESKQLAIWFVIDCLSSMQKGTIANIPDFITILGSICVLAKSFLTADKINDLVLDITTNSNKISMNRVEDLTEYLLGPNTSVSAVPEEFVKKVKEIRSVLNVSGSSLEILDYITI